MGSGLLNPVLLIVKPPHNRRKSRRCEAAARRIRLDVLGVAALLAFAAPGHGAVQSAEKLLPDETLVLISAPDWTKLSALYHDSAYGRFWNDPAMKPIKDRFISRWQEEMVKPLARELGVSLDNYGGLLQGQLTLAVTRNGWQGKADVPPGFLLLLDTRDKSAVLRTNLSALRQQWVAAGKTMRTEKLRDLEFSVFPTSSTNLPGTLRKLFPKPYEFQGPPGQVGAVKAPPGSDVEAGYVDLLLEAISGLLMAGNELVVGQVDSLLIVGNSLRAVENVAIRLTGGALPALGEVAAYQASHQALFRDAPLYGWVNVKALIEVASRKPDAKPETQAPDPFDIIPPEKIVSATGLAGVNTVACSLQASNEGLSLQLSVGVPEANRQGLFRILAGEARETVPPPFVPAEAVSFQRWRLDGQKTWATLEKILTDASSQSVSTINWILETAGARAKEKDPAFDLKKTLTTNLGDDIITYAKGPRGDSPAELRSRRSILLLGSPSTEQLTAALKALFVIFPQGDTISEREFLSRKIFSVPMPPASLITGTPARPDAAGTLHFAASTGYVALSTDAALLEEYLRSSQTPPKPLRERAGLPQAAEKVGGPGTCLFGYEDQAEAMRATFDAMKKDPGSAANANSLGLFPGVPGLSGGERHFKGWMDYSLAPPFEKVAPYFYFTVYGGSASVDGLTFKFHAPTPPTLKSNAVVKAAN